MNTRTTLFLAVMLVVLGAGYVVLRSRQAGSAPSDAVPAPRSASAVARKLTGDDLGEVVRVVCRHKDKEEWVFEKSKGDEAAAQDEWRMTAPLSAQCVKWEVDRFDSRLKNLQYEISYGLEQPGAPTLKGAGLDPPQAVVTLTDAAGKSIGVEIGRAPSRNETYVRRVGADEIVLAKANLQDLFKDSPLAYRDKLLWSFDAAKVTRVEIDHVRSDEGPVRYVLARDGARWMMQSPVTARATGKVDEMLRAMSNLRVLQWQDNDAEKVAMYGLAPGAVSVRATVEEQVPADEAEPAAGDGTEKDADESETGPPATETRIATYELVLSDRSPIGEDTKTYLRVGDENAVATVMKSVADKFTPVMSEWRDMHLTGADLSAATRVELGTPEGQAILVKSGGEWSFENDNGRAEASVVSEMLTAAKDLSAVVFVEDKPADSVEFGFNAPRAELRLSIPGVEGVERFTIGAYTDEATRRLVYVRRNEGQAVAKVRTDDVSTLIRAPLAYRDRTIVDVLPSRFERITLASEYGFGGGRTEVTLERRGADWVIAAPVEAAVRTAEVDKLLAQLGGLRAEAVVAEASQLSAYSLHAPFARIELTYKLVADSDEGADDEAATRSLALVAAQHDGKHYAHLAGRGVIYQISKEAFTQFTAEYRTDRILEFDAERVSRFSVRHGELRHQFIQRGDGWILEAEPDLPLDAEKVKNLLLQVGDLRTPRYVLHAGADPVAFGLDDPSHELSVALEDGTSFELRISKRQGGPPGERGYFGAVTGRGDVFILTEDAAKRIEVSLDDLEAS